MNGGNDWLAQQFEDHRAQLRRVAYRMLGSLGEAEDAVQEAWLRLARSDAKDIDNLGGWLTTVVSRVCLDMLRSRKSRQEDSLDESAPDTPAAAIASAANPEEEALLASSVGLALLVVLETLDPPERLAFVLHDMFDLPFEEIGAIVGRTPAAARQLASRARRRVRGAPAVAPDRLARQRKVVDAFITALRSADFEGLVAVLDPDVVVRADMAGPGGATEVRGARNWAKGALAYAQAGRFMQPALVDGAVGLVFAPRGRLQRVLRFEFDDAGRIRAAEVVSDPARLATLELAALA